jgi:hypothetical protein
MNSGLFASVKAPEPFKLNVKASELGDLSMKANITSKCSISNPSTQN